MDVTRQRIAQLMDDNSFSEISPETGDLAIAGIGRVHGRPVFVLAFQSTPFRPDAVLGTVQKIVAFLEQVAKDKYPLVFLHDTPASPEGRGGTPLSGDYLRLLTDRRGMGRMYCLQARMSEVVPTVSVLLGKVASAQAFPVALSSAAVMTKRAGLCMGRPDVVREMVGEDVAFADLGGAAVLTEVSGTVDKVVDRDEEAIDWARRYLAYLPSRVGDSVPEGTAYPPASLIPGNGASVAKDRPFDMRGLISSFIDAGSLLELSESFAGEVITGLARVEGLTVGIIANNSACKGGILFAATCRKMSRFVSFCDSYGVPILFLADVPGLMIGVDAERSGIVKAGAELFAVLARSTVEKMCVVTRKAFTGGLYAMAGPGFDTNLFLAFPDADIGVYAAETIERIIPAQTVPVSEEGVHGNLPKTGTTVQQLLDQGLLDGVIKPEGLRAATRGFLYRTRRGRPGQAVL
ncbi:carboxyl transferase domain-containing protein [Sporomusa sp.]|uniref:carboxyl transferase domain-containing protein n=1 Tax=Sporomusa sp. TaxID=2078658 RepID=UPI002CD87687|nr:carboxyl transferase domain-containing protein [Sporomusa sp.]HWR44493.1 carboxyl transferase domain-containing protein [Sporomusa sp.]